MLSLATLCFESNFSLIFAKDNIDKDDVSYVAGHCFRSVSCLNQVLFAMNEQYCINEKKTVRKIDGFNIKPQNYKEKIDRIFTLISENKDRTKEGIDILQELLPKQKYYLIDKYCNRGYS